MTFPIRFKNQNITTPKGHAFEVPTEALQKLIESELGNLKEWPAKISHKTATSLALSAIDRMPDFRKQVIEGFLRDLSSDQIIMWADEPDTLVQLQNEIWLPLIDQFNEKFKASLKPSISLFPETIEEDELAGVRSYLESLDDFMLTGLSHLADLTHSPILAILGFENKMSVDQIFSIAQLHESHQRQKWGEDVLALEREEEIKTEVEETLSYLRALSS